MPWAGTESPHSPHHPAGDGDGDEMSHPSPDTQPTAAAGLRVSHHSCQELLRPHRCANRLSQALQTSSQAPVQVPVWPKGLPGDSLPVLRSDTSSQAVGPWESCTPPKDNSPGGYSQMLSGSPGKEGGRARQPPHALSEGNGQMSAARLQRFGHRVSCLQKQHQGWLEAQPQEQASGIPVPRRISSWHKLGENSFF